MGCGAVKSIPPGFSVFQRLVSCFPVLVAALVFVDLAWSLLALVFLESLGLQAHVVGQVHITLTSSVLFLMLFSAAFDSVPALSVV
jgi:hypothetical protein